jgi:aminomethyltransferase
MRAHLAGVEVMPVTDRALLALQGPEAERVVESLAPGAAAMAFMDVAVLDWDGTEIWVSRSGYTGEDGYEISVPEGRAEALAEALLADPAVEPIGLGARDSLRLEAGLCLYGHDIDETTTPVAAGLKWVIQKVRRSGGARAGGFPGAARILGELKSPPACTRVGLRPDGRAPMREGTQLYGGETGGVVIGRVTSGGFGPSLEAPIAMGYLPPALAHVGNTVWGEVRGKRLPATVTPMPFRDPSYKR